MGATAETDKLIAATWMGWMVGELEALLELSDEGTSTPAFWFLSFNLSTGGERHCISRVVVG